MSYDGVHQPEPLAITAAAAALLISGEQLLSMVLSADHCWLPRLCSPTQNSY